MSANLLRFSLVTIFLVLGAVALLLPSSGDLPGVPEIAKAVQQRFSDQAFSSPAGLSPAETQFEKLCHALKPHWRMAEPGEVSNGDSVRRMQTAVRLMGSSVTVSAGENVVFLEFECKEGPLILSLLPRGPANEDATDLIMRSLQAGPD